MESDLLNIDFFKFTESQDLRDVLRTVVVD